MPQASKLVSSWIDICPNSTGKKVQGYQLNGLGADVTLSALSDLHAGGMVRQSGSKRTMPDQVNIIDVHLIRYGLPLRVNPTLIPPSVE